MSEKKPVQNSDMIVKVSGVLATLALITTALATIVTDTSKIWENSPFRQEDSQPIHGNIDVEASSPQGTLFTNERSSIETYNFFAQGEWSYNQKLGLLHNPGGHPEYQKATDDYKLPGFPEGALIVRRKDVYEFIGTEAKLILQPNERIYFTINDATDKASDFDSYSDNSGTLTVEWSCETCH